jgi:hypothetical protein
MGHRARQQWLLCLVSEEVMTNIEQKRQYISNLYSNRTWRKRVEKMSDDRVTAIYLAHQKDGSMPGHTDEDLDAAAPHILALPIPLNSPFEGIPKRAVRGPHHNEDDFPIV